MRNIVIKKEKLRIKMKNVNNRKNLVELFTFRGEKSFPGNCRGHSLIGRQTWQQEGSHAHLITFISGTTSTREVK
jgi:hypothetical protein